MYVCTEWSIRMDIMKGAGNGMEYPSYNIQFSIHFTLRLNVNLYNARSEGGEKNGKKGAEKREKMNKKKKLSIWKIKENLLSIHCSPLVSSSPASIPLRLPESVRAINN